MLQELDYHRLALAVVPAPPPLLEKVSLLRLAGVSQVGLGALH